MANSQYVIRLNRNIKRPDERSWEALNGASSAAVCDGQGRRGALDIGIRPVTRSAAFVGPALTIWGRPGDNAAALAAIEHVQPGDVVVLANDGATGAAIVGGHYAAMVKARGASGLISDGPARDLDELETVGLPVFARGTIPAGPLKSGPGTIGSPVTIGSVSIASGDIIVADRDGIVAIAQDRLADSVSGFLAVREKEEQMEKSIASGNLPEWIGQLIDEIGIEEV